jgi:F-type H+-transporting ATPase subunit delta
MKKNKKKQAKYKTKNRELVTSIEIIVAHDLEDGVVENLVKNFELDKKNLLIKTDKKLLGGVIIRKGSKLYDGSIRTKLNKIKKILFESIDLK